MSGASAGTAQSSAGTRAAVTLFSPVSTMMRRPVTVPLDATIREALETMDRARVDSVVIADAERRIAFGTFTLEDLVRRVSLPGERLDQPVAAVMTGGLVTLPAQGTAHQAALTMARNGMRQLVVTDEEGRLAGVVSQNDLFAVQRVGVQEIGAELQSARSVDALRAAAAGIRRLTHALLAQGIGAETLTQVVSMLNDLLTMRVVEVTADELELPPVPICWIALGSEGRLEQTFSTDQDNGIIFEAEERDAEHVRRALVPFARVVNERLDACGFRICPGDVMAGNARWCLTLDEWRRTFRRWIEVPDGEAILNAEIFFDLRAIYGNAAMAERLRQSILAAARDRPVFLRQLAANALTCRPPLGVLRDFVFDSKEFPHTVDLKIHGSRLFVDAARVLALAHGVPDTSTAERLRAVDEIAPFAPGRVAALVDAFYFVHLLRLRTQRGPADPAANRVDPRDLNELERHTLKEAFRQARHLQSRLAVEFHLEG